MKYFIKAFLPVIIVVITGSVASAQVTNNDLAMEIQKQVNAGNKQLLSYPKTVTRYYLQNNFQSTWIKPQNETGQTWQAMLMLDCVLAFGLSHDDYHPQQVTYSLLHDILDTPGKVTIKEQARFDIMLTDALIALINNLHYGKLNPDYPANKVDDGQDSKFSADTYLTKILTQKDLMVAIANVQPKVKLYSDLQQRMLLLKGKYQDDCYEVPEAEVRKIAINMERLRWAAIDEDRYILVNIPNYTLTYQLPDTAYRFKIAAGKIETPTPTLNSAIDHFTTAPDAKVIQSVFLNQILPNAVKDVNYLKNNHYAIYDQKGQFILPTPGAIDFIAKHPDHYYARHSSGRDMTHGNLVFNLPNSQQVYLHDMPKKTFFDKQDRAFSGGCVWLANAEKLGELLLLNDGRAREVANLKKGFNRYQRKTFILKSVVPVHIIYITCAVDDFGLVTYKDIYNLDKG